MAKFDGTKLIMGAVSIILGLILLPVIAGFIESEAMIGGRADGNISNMSAVENITGLTSVLSLVAYGFVFGLVGLGIGLVYLGFKK